MHVDRERPYAPAVRVALLPEDEERLAAAMVGLGLVLLASEVTKAGEPVVAEAGLGGGRRLPSAAGGSGEPPVLLFWSPSDGPVATLVDVPRPKYRVKQAVLGVEAIQDRHPDGRWRDAVDPGRSAVVRLVRSSWTDDGELRPGHFGAMAEWTPLADISPGVREKTRAAQEWVRKSGERLEVRDDRPGAYQPRTRRERQALVVWALPEAADWVRAGGRIDRR